MGVYSKSRARKIAPPGTSAEDLCVAARAHDSEVILALHPLLRRQFDSSLFSCLKKQHEHRFHQEDSLLPQRRHCDTSAPSTASSASGPLQQQQLQARRIRSARRWSGGCHLKQCECIDEREQQGLHSSYDGVCLDIC